jgi:hypothetical protein
MRGIRQLGKMEETRKKRRGEQHNPPGNNQKCTIRMIKEQIRN